MAKYTAYVNAVQSKQNSACAIIINSDTGEAHKKVLALKNCTVNRAELHGITYIVNAINEPNPDIEICTNNTYILSMLDKGHNGEWARSPTKNADLVAGLRQLVGKHGIKVSFGAGPDMEKVKWWAKSVYRLPGGLPAGAKSPIDM